MTRVPTSSPTIAGTDVPTSVPVFSIVNTTTNIPTTNIPTGTYAPTGIGLSLSDAPVLATPTAAENTTNLEREDDGSSESSSNNLIVKVIVPIMIVVAVLLCVGLYVSHRPKGNRKKPTPLASDVDLDFDPNRPDGGNSLFDEASIYTSSIGASHNNNNNKINSNRIVASKNDVSTNSVGGVINQDFTDKTEASNEEIYDNDEIDDFVGDLMLENRTITSSSVISGVTPNSFENRQIGYMEEGKMIQERYGQITKDLYSSENISPKSNTSDIVLEARSLLVSQPVKESVAVDTKNPHSPISDEGVEITFRNEKSDHTAQYDDIVGVDNASTMSYGTSNESSRISVEPPMSITDMSVNSGKILDMLANENFVSSDRLHDFDDPAATVKNRTVPPSTNALSTIAIFARGRNKKSTFGKSNSKKTTDHINNMAQYKSDEPYLSTVPAIVDSMNADDHSSMIEPFSELTTDFQYGEHDSVGSNEAHIILESITEGANGLSSSCDSSVNHTHVYENDNDSASASLQYIDNLHIGDRDTSEKYNLNLPLDLNDRDDGSANSQFDNLYESMSNEWEWKQPSLTIAEPNKSDIDATIEDRIQQEAKLSSNKSTGSSAEDAVRELGNIFLV